MPHANGGSGHCSGGQPGHTGQVSCSGPQRSSCRPRRPTISLLTWQSAMQWQSGQRATERRGAQGAIACNPRRA
eukprot:1323369-Pyramimonas_sp.AAC.1